MTFDLSLPIASQGSSITTDRCIGYSLPRGGSVSVMFFQISEPASEWLGVIWTSSSIYLDCKTCSLRRFYHIATHDPGSSGRFILFHELPGRPGDQYWATPGLANSRAPLFQLPNLLCMLMSARRGPRIFLLTLLDGDLLPFLLYHHKGLHRETLLLRQILFFRSWFQCLRCKTRHPPEPKSLC